MSTLSIAPLVETLRTQVRHLPPVQRLGAVTGVAGLIIESDGPNVGLGELCLVRSPRSEFTVRAEVVGFREHRVLLMPLGDATGLHVGCEVAACDRPPLPKPGPEMLGRVLDALGRPYDGLGMLPVDRSVGRDATPPHPLRRQRIHHSFQTGVRALDAFTPFGRGQRLGLFAGSGVGKSTLMGMIARGSEADVVVVALVGERGREVREFIEKDLGPEGLKRAIVVVATSDTPAPLRLRAAFTATAIAEAWRAEGKNVLFMMDSVTRFAMAQREIGLAVGEPAATRGYTPSVFALLPRLLERTGAGELGAITALYTVLVEGDDMNEPVADAVRGILDGHVVLSRALAHFNHYPAIDVLESVSRLIRDVCTPDEVALAAKAREHLALYRKNEDLISIGAYQKGANAALDRAIALHEPLRGFLRQPIEEHTPREQSFQLLKKILT
ncbi:FliI/YscN family ATPase [Opitutus terrae]|uniref:Flagellar protein export ATPase FliI n=1 Tax=Opitutus terrae (strain DSM 11246 / JCM 15787 / PB90-1) TaxID=452637 RepID=B1ZR42_OPITP|nr:FliI/YscN family ATPase [Opitutus terrae]ACB73709.1 flagellar protein export ATPase FliI [Opitutus terrae PB90-1]